MLSMNTPEILCFFTDDEYSAEPQKCTETVAVTEFVLGADRLALKAFEVKSIDYLLKPIGRKAIERALSK